MDEKQSVYERIMGTAGQPRAPDVPSERPPAKRRPLMFAAGLAGVLLLGFGLGWVMSQAKGLTALQRPAAQPAPAADEGKDLFTTHALARGVKTCAATYAALGKALTNGATFAFQTQVAEGAPNAHSVQGTVGMRFGASPRGLEQAAGVILVAPNGSSCEGNSVRVIPLKQRCTEATALLPPGSKPMSPLADLAFYLLPSGEQTLLVPVGDNCVAVTTLRAAS